jgi:hypothetical protein
MHAARSTAHAGGECVLKDPRVAYQSTYNAQRNQKEKLYRDHVHGCKDHATKDVVCDENWERGGYDVARSDPASPQGAH